MKFLYVVYVDGRQRDPSCRRRPQQFLNPNLQIACWNKRSTYRFLSHQVAPTPLLSNFLVELLSFFRNWCFPAQRTFLALATGQRHLRHGIGWHHCWQVCLVNCGAQWHLATESLLLDRKMTHLAFELLWEDSQWNEISLIFLTLVPVAVLVGI